MRLWKAKIIALANADFIRKSDAIVLLEGDGYERVSQVIKIFKRGLAKRIVISGGFAGARPFTIPAKELAEKIYKAGISKNKIILEEKSQNTLDQGVEVMKLVRKNRWKKIILVASHFHQPRAFLTFLKAMKNARLKIQIFNSPAGDLPWFEKTSLGENRFYLLEEEFKKIGEYSRKGHLASIAEAIEHQRWKEGRK